MIKIRVSCETNQELTGVIRLLRDLPGLSIRSCRYSKSPPERYKKAYILAEFVEKPDKT